MIRMIMEKHKKMIMATMNMLKTTIMETMRMQVMVIQRVDMGLHLRPGR